MILFLFCFDLSLFVQFYCVDLCYLVSLWLVSLTSIKVICNYKMLLRSCWPCKLSIMSLVPWETSLYLFHFSISVFISLWVLHFFCCWGHSSRQYLIVSVWFSHTIFVHVSYWSFINIRCPHVSLVCPIQILIKLSS